MSRIKIDLQDRNWKEFRIQGIEGKIVYYEGGLCIKVEIFEIPNNFLYYAYNCPFRISNNLVNRLVIGDIQNEVFHIRILCLDELARAVY